MLQYIRDNIQGLFAKVIVGFIVLVFTFWGAESIFGFIGGGPAAVATVDGEDIPEQELTQAIARQKRQMIQQMGGQVDPEQLDDSMFREPVLDSLVQKYLMLQTAGREDMVVSVATLDKLIVSLPQFQRDGQFDADIYQTILASNGFTGASYKQMLVEEMLQFQLTSGLGGSGFLTDSEFKKLVELREQQRDFEYVTFKSADFEAKVVVSDEEVQAHYEANLKQYWTQEKVIAEYIELDKNALFAEVEIDEADLRSQYEVEMTEHEASVERKVAHILVEKGDGKEAKIQQLKTRLAAGEDFAALAKGESEDIGSSAMGGELGYTTGDSFPAEMEAAIAGLSVGAISDVVETDAGYHLIKLLEENRSELPSFDASRARIERTLKQSDVNAMYVERIKDIEEYTYSAGDLSGPAEQAGLMLKVTEAFSRDGGLGIAAQSQFADMAFSEEVKEQGENSAVIELDEKAIVLRVKEHLPAIQKPLSDVSAQIRVTLVDVKARDMAKQEADEFITANQKATSLEQAAKDAQLPWQVKLDIKRSAALDRVLLTDIFKLSKLDGAPSINLLKDSESNSVVVLLRKVAEGNATVVDENLKKGMSQYFGNSKGRAELEAYQQSLKEKAEISKL